MSTTLSPSTRDTLLQELQSRTHSPGFHFLSQRHLDRLNETESKDPIVSLYMRLSPNARTYNAWEIALKDLTRSAIEQANSSKEAVRAEMQRIEETLHEGLPRTGRGLAFFACQDLDLFEQIGTTLDLPNVVHVGHQPHIRPLARMRDEHDRFVIALVSSFKTRFFFSQIGLVEEVYTLKNGDPGVTDYASKDQRQGIKSELKKTHAKQSAHAADLIVDQLGARHLIYSMPTDLESDFLSALPQSTRAKVSASFACDNSASVAEIAKKAEPVQREVEEREERETLKRIREGVSSGAVAGLSDTLEMLNQQRVMLLAVDDSQQLSGGIDTSSGMLTTETEGTYPATGGSIQPVDDLVERMLDRAMAQDAELELVRSDAAQKEMAELGPAAAVLRY